MEYQSTLTSALSYARNDKIEQWVHTFLCLDGNNKALSEGLKLQNRYFLGPLKMPLSLFSRCCGLEDTMKWVVSKDSFEKRVSGLQEAISLVKFLL